MVVRTVNYTGADQIFSKLMEILSVPGAQAWGEEMVCEGRPDGLKTMTFRIGVCPATPEKKPEPYKPSADDPVFLEAVRAAVAKIAEPVGDEDGECFACCSDPCDCDDDDEDGDDWRWYEEL